MKLSEDEAFSGYSVFTLVEQVSQLPEVKICKSLKTRTKSHFPCLSALIKHHQALLEINQILILKRCFIFSM